MSKCFNTRKCMGLLHVTGTLLQCCHFQRSISVILMKLPASLFYIIFSIVVYPFPCLFNTLVLNDYLKWLISLFTFSLEDIIRSNSNNPPNRGSGTFY